MKPTVVIERYSPPQSTAAGGLFRWFLEWPDGISTRYAGLALESEGDARLDAIRQLGITDLEFRRAA